MFFYYSNCPIQFSFGGKIGRKVALAVAKVETGIENRLSRSARPLKTADNLVTVLKASRKTLDVVAASEDDSSAGFYKDHLAQLLFGVFIDEIHQVTRVLIHFYGLGVEDFKSEAGVILNPFSDVRL